VATLKSINVAVCIITIIMLVFVSNLIVQPARAQTSVTREVTIPVKVVFVGIDARLMNTTYIEWEGNLPVKTYGEVLNPSPGGSLTGMVYDINFTFTFADNNYKTKLESYLHNIQVMKKGPNPWFYNYTLQHSTGYVSTSSFYSTTYVTYDANEVESWIYTNQQDLGGFPSNGYTIMLLNLTELPSYDFRNYRDFLVAQRSLPPNGTAHYYSVNYSDIDLGYRLRYRDFMTGWGGVHRLWFNDLSAGPSFWTWPEDMPLQIALEDNHINLDSEYGKTWMTQYLADYISQASWNLVTPFFEYQPLYSNKYTFAIHVFDNRTDLEKNQVNIESTINKDKILHAFQDLLPYSNVEVTVSFDDLNKFADLEHLIDSNYKYTDSFTFGVSGQPLQYGIVDARPVYKYLEDNLQSFEPEFHRDRNQFTIPVFAFAFSNDTLFTFTYKWEIANSESDVKALLGVALGDLAMVSMSQQEFLRGNYVEPAQPNRGEGFTEVIIHESGHMLGLPHPHNFGPVGDFTLSVMGYYTYDYVFGQFDKDALRRAHVDQVYLEIQSMLQQAPAGLGGSIRSQLQDVDAKYADMDYVGALNSIISIETQMIAVSTIGSAGQSLVYVVVGAVGGFVFAWLLFRRKHQDQYDRVYSTRTTPSVVRFCTNCGAQAQVGNRYCHECGNRLPSDSM